MASHNSGEYHLGVDVGGTFTDACAFSPHGRIHRAKVLSTPADQSVGVQDAITKLKQIIKQQEGWSGKFASVHHGTTVATNAILENKGVPAALVVTKGHKDVLAARRSQIPGGLAAWIEWIPPDPVIPLERTVQCLERTAVDGSEVTPVDSEALIADLESLKGKVKAVTISLLNSYVNGAHERQVAKIVQEVMGADVEVVCSHEVLPEAGEYERTVTAAANAVVKPEVRRYLEGLAEKLASDTDTIRILKSDGGLTSVDWAAKLPVNILMSGPAGGVRGITSVIAQATEHKNLLTLDMGGTSTDVALIAGGEPELRRETKVDVLTVRSPSIDVITIGAGGGSLAVYQPLTSALRVGPESAGAFPGPACYGKGGKRATVSDANLVLGYLPDKLLGGEFELDTAASYKAISELAAEMNQGIMKTAEDIYDLANENMFGALRNVSVQQGHDPRDFALVCFGGAGPLHANALGKLIGAWPVIIPAAPGILCAQGDATTKLSHELSLSFMQSMADMKLDQLRKEYNRLSSRCKEIMSEQLGTKEPALAEKYQADVRYKGQALELTVLLQRSDLDLGKDEFEKVVRERFDALHQQQFSYVLSGFALELTRLGVVTTDASPVIQIPRLPKGEGINPPDTAVVSKNEIVVHGKKHMATFWDRAGISKAGWQVMGPCVVTEMDSNTLILPGFVGTVDHVGNLLISPLSSDNASKSAPSIANAVHSIEEKQAAARKYVDSNPTLPTLVASSLASIRSEMDTLMLTCAMSPAVRDQQDEFNVITNPRGQMLVGQFGSFVASFKKMWDEKIERGDETPIVEGDVIVTNDVYEVGGAVTHLNDVIVLLPIWYEHKCVGWASNFAHMSDIQGQVPGSMSINATTIFDDGLQIPCVRLYAKGVYNKDMVDLICRNSRQPDWLRSDLTALVAACRTAATRVGEMCARFGPDVYLAATDVLLARNHTAIAKLIDHHMSDEESVFWDVVDDDGHGNGPFALKCKLTKENGKLVFDFDGTSPQSSYSINFWLSETMLKMFIGYYLLVVFDPYTVVNDGFHDLIDIRIPLGSVLKPVRPASVSCRTHFLGRTMDIIQALFGQRNEHFLTAAGFSDSPHFFYSGWKEDGTWYQLYQIAFGGVPARPKGDGPDCHCLFPAIKSIPTESIELNYPIRLDVNEAVPDTGGAGHYRGGNAQRTAYRFLARGEFSIHDDRWFTKPWGVRGGRPGARSRKTLHHTLPDGVTVVSTRLPSKCDHVAVVPGDVLEWQTWGGGGLGDPLSRPAEVVALEVRRKLVTVGGARANYGVVVNGKGDVDGGATEVLRAEMAAAVAAARKKEDGPASLYDRGGSLEELALTAMEETGFEAPRPQWLTDPYGPHVALPYVREWYRKFKEHGYKAWDM